MTTCRECGASGQPDGARFCFTCGVSLDQTRCVSCRAEIVPGARFCSACGAAQEVGDAPAPHQPVASRRITSVLFGDLVAFTSLAESRDQEEVRELLSRYFEECSQIVARYVEDAHDQAPPTGITARMRGLLASLDDAPPEQVESWFRTAVTEADGWRSAPTAARARADLGVWLLHEGRIAEAEPLLAAARETFERLGARRWSAQLDARLAGALA